MRERAVALHRWRGIREAVAYYLAGLAKLTSLSDADKAGRADLGRLHGAYMRLVSVQLGNGDARGALAYAQAALELSSRLSAGDPKDAYARLDVATDYANRADALRRFRSALTMFEKVRAEDRNNVDARLHVVAILVKVADMLAENGDDEEAGNSYRSALKYAGADSLAEQSEEARYAIASADLGLSAIEFRAASRRHLNAAAQREHAAAACDWYARGARVWAAIREPSEMSPNGFYTAAPALLRREAARCASVTAVPGT